MNDDRKTKFIGHNGMIIGEFYDKFFPGITDEQKAEFEAEATKDGGIDIETALKNWRADWDKMTEPERENIIEELKAVEKYDAHYTVIENMDDFYNKYFPNMTPEQRAEFEAEAGADGILADEMIKKYRPDLTETEQAELLDEIDREVLRGEP